MSPEAACRELERCAGEQFDPRVVALFVEQVRLHPPGSREGAELEGALDDPEVRAQLEPGEPVVGYGPSGAVDNLTLLYAHRHLHEQAARLAEESELAGVPYAVLLVELSALTEINARDGYAAGDRAIVEVARAVSDVAAQVHGTACRYGGRRLARAGAGHLRRRAPRRWGGTWSGRWRPTGPPCARPPPSGGPAIRPPPRSAAPGWNWPAHPCRRRPRPSSRQLATVAADAPRPRPRPAAVRHLRRHHRPGCLRRLRVRGRRAALPAGRPVDRGRPRHRREEPVRGPLVRALLPVHAGQARQGDQRLPARAPRRGLPAADRTRLRHRRRQGRGAVPGRAGRAADGADLPADAEGGARPVGAGRHAGGGRLAARSWPTPPPSIPS